MTGGFVAGRFLAASEIHKPGWLGVGIMMVVTCLAGCSPQVGIQGLVSNIAGEPLPGVSVRVEATGAFSVSNGNGMFGKRPNTLSVAPGTWEIAYFKTGFTSVHKSITTGDGRLLELPPVQLWPLPPAKGVYVLEGLTYEPFTRVTPERYIRENNTPVFGVKLTPELKLPAAPAMIISHRMANYDWQLSRLEQITVLREGFEPAPKGETPKEGAESRTETIWAASVRLPMETAALDEPEQQLWHITPNVELGPGIYAIHWGALDGDPGTEASAYLLQVIDPNAPPEPVEAEAPEAEAKPEKKEAPEETVDLPNEAPEYDVSPAEEPRPQ